MTFPQAPVLPPLLRSWELLERRIPAQLVQLPQPVHDPTGLDLSQTDRWPLLSGSRGSLLIHGTPDAPEATFQQVGEFRRLAVLRYGAGRFGWLPVQVNAARRRVA